MSPENAVRIGRYELVAPLGQGGMARVHLAVSHGPVGFDKLVVVKQLRPELAWDQEFLTMFFNEARIAARLNHPNVVQTYEVVEEAGQYLLAMEYLEGHSLSQVLQRVHRERMPLEEHLWILTQVLAGLHYAHELRDYDGRPLGVVHRDVSPSNVFITYNGDVKLVDFGIAKVAGASVATEQGKIKGKIGYSAPEQLLCKPVDGRADVFAVGVMLWEALAQQRRKLADSPAAIFQARLAGLEPRISEARPELPAALADICDRAMSVEAGARFQNAAEMQHALERYLERGGRQVGRREVAALLAQHFTIDRKALRQRIEAQVGPSVQLTAPPEENRTPQRGLPATPALVLSLPPPPTPPPDAGEMTGTRATTNLRPPGVELPGGRRRGRLYAAAAAGALVVMLAVILLTRSRPGPAPVIAAPPRPPAVAPVAAVPVPAPVPPPAAPIAPVAAEPAAPDEPEETQAVPSARHHRTRIRRARAQAPAPGVERPKVERPKAPAVEPGMDLAAPAASRPGRQIDEKDPYTP